MNMPNNNTDFEKLTVEEKKSIYRSTIAQSLVRYRKEQDWLQIKMAERLNIKNNTLSQYEHAERGFPSELVPIFCEIVHIPISSFFNICEKAYSLTSEELEEIIDTDRRLIAQRISQPKKEIIKSLRNRYLKLKGELNRNSELFRTMYNICGNILDIISETGPESDFKTLKRQAEYYLESLEKRQKG